MFKITTDYMNNKEITIYDIAKRLNVSTATVSRSLNNHPAVSKKTKKKIEDAAREMGYRSNLFASNLRKRNTHTLGVIIPKLNSSFVSSVLAGIESVASQSGYNLIIAQSHENVRKEIENVKTLFNSRVDGLIASLAFDTKDISHFAPFFEKEIPVIFFDRVSQDQKGARIVIDNFKAGYEATIHLIEQGCKRIAHITGNLSRNVYDDRLKGFKAALSEHNLPFQKEGIIINNLDEESTIAAAEQILALPTLPDGLFITNDSCAAICMQKLKESGIRIPEDMAIVGFNNDLISRIIEPNITTVNYPGKEMGEIVAHQMVNHLEGISPMSLTNTIIINSELIIRGSSLKNNK